MKKSGLVLIFILVAIYVLVPKNIFLVAAEDSDEVLEQKIYCDATVDDDFCDNLIFVVLNEENSRFSGVSEQLSAKLLNIGAESIIDCSALSAEYLNDDGSINQTVAPNLARHYSENSFNQILKVVLSVQGKQEVLDAIFAIQEFEEVLYAGPSYNHNVGQNEQFDINDANRWALNNTQGISAEAAWDITRGSSDVKVGVIDSGISVHSDLLPNVSYEEGYDFYHEDDFTKDDLGGHGTSVASIIGGARARVYGVSGVAPETTLIPFQTAYNTTGTGSHRNVDVIEAITEANNRWEDDDDRIDILNYSVENFGVSVEVAYAVRNYPGLFVWSAGNFGVNTDLDMNIGEFDLPNLISVGAINESGQKWLGSNYGQNSVNVYAPGENVFAADRNSWYREFTGTSAAAPHVSGVAALMLAVNPDLTASEMKKLIIESGDSINIYVTNGTQNVKKLNAYEAVRRALIKTTNIGTNQISVDGLYQDFEGEFSIPQVLKGRTVTEISDGAFEGQTGITAITLPATLQTIGESAFAGLNIESLVIPSGVTTIGDGAFAGCCYLQRLVLPATIEFIGRDVFAGWSGSQTVHILSDAEEYGDIDDEFNDFSGVLIWNGYGEYYTQGLVFNQIEGEDAYEVGISIDLKNEIEIVVIPAVYEGMPVTKIQDYGFYECWELKKVILPTNGNLTCIGEYAFALCTALENINIPDGVTEIGTWAFCGAEDLMSVTVPVSTETADVLAFDNINNCTIYFEAESMPDGWDYNPSHEDFDMIFGCELSEDKSYVVSIVHTNDNQYADGTIMPPYREGFAFAGWATTEGSSTVVYTMADIADGTVPNGTTLYAVWVLIV